MPSGVTRHREAVVWVTLAGLAGVLVAVTSAFLGGGLPPGWVVTVSMLSWLGFLLVYPSGRPEPQWLVGVAVVCAAAVLGGARLAFVPGFAVLAGAQVWRYQRRSSVAERQATKWLLLGLGPALGIFLGAGLIAELPGAPAGMLDHQAYSVLSLIGMWAVPVAAAAGLVLGERGPVDDLVRLVVTVVGTVVLVALVHTLAWPAGPAWATIAACLAVLPGVWAFSRLGIWLAYARGPQRALADLTPALAGTSGPDEVGPVVATTLRRALAVPAAQVSVDGALVARDGDGRACPVEVPVQLHGDQVAVLAIAPREGDVRVSRRDLSVVQRVALVAAPALSGVRAAREAEEARRAADTVRDRERGRLHADLHDELGPSLAGLAMTAAAASASLGTADSTARSLLTQLQAGIGRTASRVRELAYDLRPPDLAQASLEALLNERLAGPEPPRLLITVELTGPPLPDDVVLAIVRIATEAVTNVRRHAGATTCAVTVRQTGTQVTVGVEDNGRGPAQDTIPGIGLASIRQRAEALGGTAWHGPRTGGGFRLEARLVPDQGTTVP